jgi:hypothetical protein
MASGLLMELILWRLAARAGVGMARRATGDFSIPTQDEPCSTAAEVSWNGVRAF